MKPLLPRRVYGQFLRLAATAALLATALAQSLPAAYYIGPQTLGPADLWPTVRFEGSSVVLELVSTTDPYQTLQWWHDDAPIAGATAPQLTLENLSAEATGNYYVELQTPSGPVHSSNTVTLNILPPLPSPVDPGFIAGLPDSTRVQTLTVLPGGQGLMVRYFDSTQTAHTVRLESDGQSDATLVFPDSAGTVLAAFADGGLITNAAPYRLAADGSTIGLSLPASFDPTETLSAAVIAPDGSFYISQHGQMARFNPDGTSDDTFQFSVPNENFIYGLTLDPAGRVLVSGSRLNPVAGSYPFSWAVCYRLAADGSLDSTFPVQESEPLLNGAVSLYPLADGSYLYRAHYHGYRTWKRLDENGTPDPEWTADLYTDSAILVDGARALLYAVASNGDLDRYRIGTHGLDRDDQFYAGFTSFLGVTKALATDGSVLLYGGFKAWDGRYAPGLVRLNTDQPPPDAFPANIYLFGGSQTPNLGQPLTLNATVTSSTPATYTWLALDGQPLPADSSSPTLTFDAFRYDQRGRYQLRVTNAYGTMLSSVTALLVDDALLPRLSNLSGRAVPGPGENITVAGFSVHRSGTEPLETLCRGVGPALKHYGVQDTLPNPAIDLYDGTGRLVSNNDNWGDNPGKNQLRIDTAATGAFALPDGSLDAALSFPVFASHNTLQLFDQSGDSGVSLAEIYRVPGQSADADELTNLSLRAFSGPGEKVAIAGFVVSDPLGLNRPLRLLLRVIGPSLSAYGISHPLSDPLLALRAADGSLLRRIDNWGDDADPTALAATMASVGAFALDADSADAATVIELPPGAYTLLAESADTSEGIALLEIYVVR